MLHLLQAERDYDLNRAAELKYGTLVSLQNQLKEVEEELRAKGERGMLREGARHVACTCKRYLT